jgi:ATP-dependent Clp protease protease subunit
MITAGMLFRHMNYIKCDISPCIEWPHLWESILLANGKKVKRSTSNSKILIHQPIGGAEGQASVIAIAAKRI